MSIKWYHYHDNSSVSRHSTVGQLSFSQMSGKKCPSEILVKSSTPICIRKKLFPFILNICAYLGWCHFNFIQNMIDILRCTVENGFSAVRAEFRLHPMELWELNKYRLPTFLNWGKNFQIVNCKIECFNCNHEINPRSKHLMLETYSEFKTVSLVSKTVVIVEHFADIVRF